MKKALALMMVVGILFSCIPAFADGQVGFSGTQYTEKWNAVNNTANAVYVVIPTSKAANGRAYIQPGKHRIVSLFVQGFPANATVAGIPNGSTATEGVAAIYDATSIASANNKNIEGEIEHSNQGGGVTLNYTRPLKVKNGIVLIQGAFTTVKLEYERIQP